MRASTFLIAAVVTIGAQSCTSAGYQSTPLPPQAEIPFASSEIYTWAVANDHSVYVEANNRQWYRGDLMGHCADLPFAQHIGFAFNPDGSFDRSSSIFARGQKCPLVSLSTTSPPRGSQSKHAPTHTETKFHQSAETGPNRSGMK